MSTFGLTSNLASSLRTVHFGTLMTRLGYEYNIEDYKPHADRIAQLMLKQQIKKDGIVSTTDGNYYRPTTIGGFPMSWNNSLKVELNQPSYYQAVGYLLGAQKEYGGIIPTNTETTMDALAFLSYYKRLVYKK